MSPAEQEAFVATLQVRRLRVVEDHRRLVAEWQAAEQAKLKQQLSDQLRMVERDIAAVERAMDRVEKRVNKIAALRAAAGE